MKAATRSQTHAIAELPAGLQSAADGAYRPPSLLAIDFSARPSMVQLTGGQGRHIRSGTALEVIGAAYPGVAPDVEAEMHSVREDSIAAWHDRVVDWMRRYLEAYPTSTPARVLTEKGYPLEVGFPFEVVTMDSGGITTEICGMERAGTGCR